MGARGLTRSTLVVLLSAGLLWAGEPWEESPYTAWTGEEVEQVLHDSPWARRVDVPVGLQQENQGAYDLTTGRHWVTRRELLGHATVVKHAPCYVRWASSGTIREGWVRRWQLEGTVSAAQAQRWLAVKPEPYVISVSPISDLGVFAAAPAEELARRSAYLETKGTEKRVQPARVVFRGETALFYFPRQVGGQASIGAREAQVKFVWQATERRKVKTTFDLRKMKRAGRPDL